MKGGDAADGACEWPDVPETVLLKEKFWAFLQTVSVDSADGTGSLGYVQSSPFAATVESWRGDVSSIVPTPTSPPGTAGKFAVPSSLTDAIYGQLPSPLDRRGRMQY